MSQYRWIQVFIVLLYCSIAAGLDIVANEGKMSTICVFTGIMGLSLGLLISQEIIRLERENDSGTVPLTLTLFGIYGCVLTAVGDKTHYMNRDDPTWSYINIGLSAFLVFFAFLLSLDWVQKGCCC